MFTRNGGNEGWRKHTDGNPLSYELAKFICASVVYLKEVKIENGNRIYPPGMSFTLDQVALCLAKVST